MVRKVATKKAVAKQTHNFANKDPNSFTLPSANKVVAGQMITNNITSYIMNMSNFDALKDDQIFEQMYKHDGDIGSGIDRISTLISESFKGIVPTNIGEQLDSNEEACLLDAKKIYEAMRVDNLAEAYGEVLMKNGNLYIDYRKPLAPSILPNQYVTFIPDMAFKNMASQMLFTDPKYLIINERLDPKFPSEVIPRDKYIHVKYKDTPVMSFDNLNRQTFGIYSISPLHRCIIPVWWRRQMMMIDVLLRSRMIPREHHKIMAEIFSLDNYSGTAEEQHARQAADVSLFITSYINSIKEQAPDQGYVTLDTVDIKTINDSANYVQSNELLKQIQADIYTGLNVPASIVNGKDAGSYASELVVSNYVSAKVIQLAKKIKYVILKIIRDRLLIINASYPVEIVDIKLELILSMNRLEAFRQLSLMVAAGVFTEDEIRSVVAFGTLTEEQREHIVSSGRITIGDPGEIEEPESPEAPKAPGQKMGVTSENVSANATRGGNGEDAEYPDTDKSAGSHTRDASEEILRTK